MKDEGYISLDEKDDFVLVHSFEQARIKNLEYFNPMTLIKTYVGHELTKFTSPYMKLVSRLTHSTNCGRWTEAMTRRMQRARQPTSLGLRIRREKDGDVFEWRTFEHMPKSVSLKVWADHEYGECFPCWNLGTYLPLKTPSLFKSTIKIGRLSVNRDVLRNRWAS